VLTRPALAFVFFIVDNLLQAINSSSLFVMLFLIADVVYHPFQILRAETNHTIAGLPIQDFAINELVIDVVRTRAFNLSDPFADQ
jgi:hypothetical protein